MTTDRDRLFAVADRELVTVVRTPASLLAAVGFAVVTLGLALASGLTGYVPLVVDLLVPVEVLVPLLAVAFGYRSLGAGAATTERPVLRTYPVPRWAYVGGVFLGRAAVVLPVVFATLVIAGVLVPVLGPEGTPVIATHGGEGSFVAYLRFVVLATAYAGTVLAAVVAASAVTATARTAVAAAVSVVVLLTVGIDLGFVGGLAAGVLDPGALGYLQALGPNSAFRGLVLALVVRTVETAAIPAGVVVAYALGLAVWIVGSLALATALVWDPQGAGGWHRAADAEGVDTVGTRPARGPPGEDGRPTESSTED